MRAAEATVEGMTFAVNHATPATMSAATMLTAALPAFQTVFNNQHNAADLAEGPTSEAACHTVSNVLFNALITQIAARRRPLAPTGLTAVMAGPASIRLNWLDNACNETAYRIYRRSGRGAFAIVSSLPIGTRIFKYTTPGLTAATTYTYKVVAVGTAGESAPSNLVNITTP